MNPVALLVLSVLPLLNAAPSPPANSPNASIPSIIFRGGSGGEGVMDELVYVCQGYVTPGENAPTAALCHAAQTMALTD